MLRLLSLSLVGLVLSGCVTNDQTKKIADAHWSKNMTKVMNYQSAYIKGINSQQAKKIAEIGDPLGCIDKVEKIKSIKSGNLITKSDYDSKTSIIQKSLNEHDVTFLQEGVYKLKRPLYVYDSILVGLGNVVIDASDVDSAIGVDRGSVANLKIHGARRQGIKLSGPYSNLYNLVIMNTGVEWPDNTYGHGVHATGIGTHSNCLVSIEALHGYNEKGASHNTIKGGNADGFSIKYGSYNFTLIDVHAHHNSDDGFDFWKAGHGAPIENDDISIRVFYSSANLNGKNPLTTSKNGDGNGFKFGSKDKHQRPKKDKGARLIYGSVACNNLVRGFDRNGTRTKIIAENLEARSNPKYNFKDVRRKNSKDEFKLKCSYFPSK